MMRLTPTAPMPSLWNSAVAVVRIRSRGLADTMRAGPLLACLRARENSLYYSWALSSQREQQLLGLLEGGGGAGLAEEGDGPLQLVPALGGAGGQQPAGRAQAGRGLVGAAADLGVGLGRPTRVAGGEGPGRVQPARGQDVVQRLDRAAQLDQADRQVDAELGLEEPPAEGGQQLVQQLAGLGLPAGGEQHPGPEGQRRVDVEPVAGVPGQRDRPPGGVLALAA